jgi:hypothetical protein
MLDQSTPGTTRIQPERLSANCRCEQLGDGAAADPAQRLSTHRTSQGHVIYYRCYCGRPSVALVHPCGHKRAALGVGSST